MAPHGLAFRCCCYNIDMSPTADNLRALNTPDKIAEAGQRLYAERHQAQLEKDRSGQFVAIDVLTGEGYVAEFPEQALEHARKQAPNGVFHLIRIGAPGAFKVSYSSQRHDRWSWILRQSR